ncbi:versatile peroxidase VPS1 [Mycena sanguinolenta]|nr:versatile peroxidase VPS1 [Mycena sanguinolenta]
MKLSLLWTSSLVCVSSVTATFGRATCSKGRTTANAACCVWYNVLDDLQADVFGKQCGQKAHHALRVAFHDAISYSPQLQSQGQYGGGGSDGSIMKFESIEFQYPQNAGLKDVIDAEKIIADDYGVAYGDMIQFSGVVSVRNCVNGPRIPFMAGRPAAIQPSPDGLVPAPFDSVDKILARIEDAGLTPQDLIELMASHSIAGQEQVDPKVAGTPLDLTPTVFDTNFYRDTLIPGFVYPGNDGPHVGESMSPFFNEFRLQSDFELARDPRTSGYWLSLALNPFLMSSSFATSMAKMALIGQNPSILHDCSDVIP